jgi:hypothetical protein
MWRPNGGWCSLGKITDDGAHDQPLYHQHARPSPLPCILFSLSLLPFSYTPSPVSHTRGNEMTTRWRTTTAVTWIHRLRQRWVSPISSVDAVGSEVATDCGRWLRQTVLWIWDSRWWGWVWGLLGLGTRMGDSIGHRGWRCG